MLNFDISLKVLEVISLIVMPFFIISFLLCLINKLRKKKPPIIFTTISGLLFVITIATFFVIQHFSRIQLRDYMMRYLNELDESVRVRIDLEYSENPMDVVTELKKMKTILAHHSHPVKCRIIEIFSKNGDLELELCQDSDYVNEYWILYPIDNNRIKKKEIGRIRTNFFCNISKKESVNIDASARSSAKVTVE